MVIVGVVTLGLLQLANPVRTNPPVVSDLITVNPPQAKVAALLHAACYDCHSYETKWPWYSKVAPVSWLVANDVNEGRRHLNFSDWPQQSPDKAARRFDAISDEVGHGDMPPGKYTAIHGDARLSADDRKLLTDWADAQSAKLGTATPGK